MSMSSLRVAALSLVLLAAAGCSDPVGQRALVGGGIGAGAGAAVGALSGGSPLAGAAIGAAGGAAVGALTAPRQPRGYYY